MATADVPVKEEINTREQELETMTLEELKRFATSLKISYGNASKSRIISKIIEVEESQGSDSHSAKLARTLHLPDESKPFILQADASESALGALLIQADTDGRKAAVAYATRKLSLSEIYYITFEKECLAVIWAIETFAVYLERQNFIIQANRESLLWLYRMRHENQRLMGWTLLLNKYGYDIEYRNVGQEANIDVLSIL